MSTFIIDVPVPSMGATVSELTIVNIAVASGAQVVKGQKLAELESDKSAFDFESPGAGTIIEIKGAPGAVMTSGQALFRMQTDDASLRHLEIQRTEGGGPRTENRELRTENREQKTGNRPQASATPPASARPLTWTPRAIKMAHEAGLDYPKITDIEATGPGGRVSGDDVAKYLADRK
jgi:pyruvate/2-oxoglutarate dehydrogenase complex dihydrolipoamide acyltransferase (E2) component